ncbi:hypothetical protein HJG60_010637 [Phyllostomus discolor]|uniref:Uncharacterized protein n=1 Tax=Phyllostomus discolor TaxID=89673 RepID=A0A834EHN9_9CHIR|nr:hypothetical protein HJG60_010637 [Phyllostomus discolor]
MKALSGDVLGHCQVFKEARFGGKRYNSSRAAPRLRLAPSYSMSNLWSRQCMQSLHNAIVFVRRTIENDSVVAGGGDMKMELCKYLQDYSRTIPGKQQLLIGAYAKALEITPCQLCHNAGFHATNILNMLWAWHTQRACGME